jgi:hypothetical protein
MDASVTTNSKREAHLFKLPNEILADILSYLVVPGLKTAIHPTLYACRRLYMVALSASPRHGYLSVDI